MENKSIKLNKKSNDLLKTLSEFHQKKIDFIFIKNYKTCVRTLAIMYKGSEIEDLIEIPEKEFSELEDRTSYEYNGNGSVIEWSFEKTEDIKD